MGSFFSPFIHLHFNGCTRQPPHLRTKTIHINRSMKKLIFKVLSLFAIIPSFAQTVSLDPTISPEFFAADEQITITYDVTGTALHELENAWIWLWLPDLNNYDVPSNVNPASDNPSATDAAKCTKTTTDDGRVLFSITIVLTEFTDQTADVIETVGVLLKGNDWSDGQTSDYIFNTSDGFTLALDNPSGKYGFYESGERIPIEAKTSEPADIALYIDGEIKAEETDVTSLTYTHTIIDDGAVHEIKVTASTATETDEVVYAYSITPTTEEVDVPSGLIDGINYASDQSGAHLVLTAPNKDFVFVIGSFNDWSINQDYLMKKSGDKFWIELNGIEAQKEYLFQYLVDGEIRIADPYAEKIASQFDDGEIIADGRYPGLEAYPTTETSEAASFLQTGKTTFEWADFTPPAKEDLIIYELLVRDFSNERTYNAVTGRLDYLQDLGINALELMPVMEFEGNISWGYNPSSMLAVDKYYGTEEELKILINECHKRGIAVILDIVLNHQFGRNSLVRLYNEDLYGNPTSENPWFNTVAKHDFNVGYDMNHDSQYTKDYVNRVVRYWIEEYNIDGYRFDLSKGFTQKNTLGNTDAWGQYDADRVELWKNIADTIWNIDPDNYVILEHFAENSEEKELADYGMMIWGNMNGTYRSLARGGNSDIGWLYHGERDWNEPHAIGYMESHDEERVMWTLVDNAYPLQEALDRTKLLTSFFLTVPGPKMIWQFGEMGYDEELNNDRLGIKPTHWEYLEDPERVKLFDLYKSLTNLRTKTDYIKSEYFNWSSSDYIKWITIEHPDVDIYLIGNFDTDSQTGTHQFPQTGTWYNYFTGAEIQVTDANAEVTLAGGGFAMYTSAPIDNYIETNPITLSGKAVSDTNILYPNPSKGELKFTKSIHGEVIFTDLSGKKFSIMPTSENIINTASLARGLYVVQFQDEGIIKQQKIFIE